MSHPTKRPTRHTAKSIFFLFVSTGLVLSVIYIGATLLAPQLTPIPYISASPIDLNKQNDATDNRNRVQIDKMGIEVPFFTGDANVLEKGAWHRKPENGNPEKGGNFILAAHRFEIGNTPGETRRKSPFFKIDSLVIGDKIRVFYQKKWYTYSVSDKIEVTPTSLYIENPSVEPRLTLYSCMLSGAAAGRYVIIATPDDD